MKKAPFVALIFFIISVSAQNIVLNSAKFITGDNLQWKDTAFIDASWNSIRPDVLWDEQGYNYDGYAWYRFHFKLPSSLKSNSYWKDSLRIWLSKIDDVDEVFLNGEKIGQTGSFPTDPGGYSGRYDEVRDYHIAANSDLLRWDGENLVAVRVFDGGGGGGMHDGTPYINMMDLIDGAELQLTNAGSPDNRNIFHLTNNLQVPLAGDFSVTVRDGETHKTISTFKESIQLSPLQSISKDINAPQGKRVEAIASFKEKNTGKIKSLAKVLPYILTPATPQTPRINGAKIFGVRPSSPFLYKIAATGQKPLKYAVQNIPRGLVLDETTGVISGILSNEGEYKMQLIVSNGLGKAEREFTIKVGNLLALTPAMGWNSWNCWGLSVSDEKVRSSAQALIDKGLIDHGWTYINIDDGWQSPKRAGDGTIVPNEKFPDMKTLGDWLHAHGLKFGIYSSPGPFTCGSYTGSYQHEMQDATSYSQWGIDYLKYDWCSFGNTAGKDTSLDIYQKPYHVMQHALKAQSRDIYYSLCQYGMKDVWKWGHEVDGNSWRTTGDIVDTWESLSSIGFNQDIQYLYAHPGHWNDPDMLIVGQVGWGEQLHTTRLTPDEQYTHISLWCLLSAPLLIGCDISKLDDFTLNLLTNDEVLALDQDVLGKQAQRKVKKDNYQVWMKELEDGSKAVGIFNVSDTYQTITLNWKDAGLYGNYKTRDIWRQKDLGMFKTAFTTKVPPHGVTLIKVWK